MCNSHIIVSVCLYLLFGDETYKNSVSNFHAHIPDIRTYVNNHAHIMSRNVHWFSGYGELRRKLDVCLNRIYILLRHSEDTKQM